MRAGRLRHLVEIQTSTTTQDSMGSAIATWTEYGTVWASVEPISGREFFSANQVQSNVSTRIRIRYLEGVTPKMRVLHAGIYYDIEAVLPDSKSGIAEMHLMCARRGAEGFRNG